jgi:DNA-binding MarR family transcriptional regulator
MTRWLSKEQQAHWRSWITASTVLHEQLSRELQEKHGLTITDYQILVRLSESENRSNRMSDLASLTLLSRSRLSHQIDRMEAAGLVSREVCPDDRRGQLAVLTNAGMKALVAAAPDHVEGVRKHFVDLLLTLSTRRLVMLLRKLPTT